MEISCELPIVLDKLFRFNKWQESEASLPTVSPFTVTTSRIWSSRKVKITSVKRGLVCSIKSTYGTLEYVVPLSNETAWAQHVLDSNTSYMVTWRSWLRSCESFKFSLNCQHISCRTFTMEESFVPISRFIGIECEYTYQGPFNWLLSQLDKETSWRK